MIRFSHHKDVAYPIEKINHIYRLLRRKAKDYEALIISIEDKKIRDVLNRLANTSNQFAVVLFSGIHSFANVPGVEPGQDDAGILPKISNAEDTVLDFFTATEKVIVDAYRDVLNQPFINTEFRQMINFQLNEMLYLFMHLKLMHSLKVKMY